jgi:31-O-methyltransferase
MIGFLPSTRLPNGKNVYYLGSPNEPVSTYHQVQDYFKHGISVKPGDVIVDVGANIGLFSLAVSERCQNQAHIYALEPLPQTYKALCRNVLLLGLNRVNTFQLGIAQEPGTLSFRYYPNSSASSTAFPDFDLYAARERLLEGFANDPILTNYRWLTKLPLWLTKPFLNVATLVINFGYSVTCQVTTISEFIRSRKLATIDLLKIDAEKAELDILRGIKLEDWPKIRQVVIELHHGKRDLPVVSALLKGKGFKTIRAEYELGLEHSQYLTVYALR